MNCSSASGGLRFKTKSAALRHTLIYQDSTCHPAIAGSLDVIWVFETTSRILLAMTSNHIAGVHYHTSDPDRWYDNERLQCD